MAVAADGLERLYQSLDRLSEKAAGTAAGSSAPDDRIEAWRQDFITAMDDDFNSAAAVAVLFEVSKEINRWLDEEKTSVDPQTAAQVAEFMREIGEPLGLLQEVPRDFLQRTTGKADGQLEAAEIESLIAARAAARKERNWAEADRVRDILDENGIILKDSAEGTKWQRKR